MDSIPEYINLKLIRAFLITSTTRPGTITPSLCSLIDISPSPPSQWNDEIVKTAIPAIRLDFHLSPLHKIKIVYMFTIISSLGWKSSACVVFSTRGSNNMDNDRYFRNTMTRIGKSQCTACFYYLTYVCFSMSTMFRSQNYEFYFLEYVQTHML